MPVRDIDEGITRRLHGSHGNRVLWSCDSYLFLFDDARDVSIYVEPLTVTEYKCQYQFLIGKIA